MVWISVQKEAYLYTSQASELGHVSLRLRCNLCCQVWQPEDEAA